MHIQNFDPYDFSKKEIEGVPVYYKNLSWAPCIYIHIAFPVGAFQDPVGKEGIAHFLEHMVGNGSESLPNKKAMWEFSRLYMLGSKNAYTGHNITAYIGKCLPEHFEHVIRTMHEYTFFPLLRSEDMEHEHRVISQEAWGRYKNELFLKYIKETTGALYQGHEKARIASPLGWPETVSAITHEDVVQFHKTHYTKQNAVIMLVGAIEERHLECLSDILKNTPEGTRSEKHDGVLGKPLTNRIEKTSEEIGDPREQLEFSMARAMSGLSEKEGEVGNRLGDLLYDALFERLRTEHSLCYGVSVRFSRGKGYHECHISVDTSTDKLELVEKEIWNVIQEIQDGKWQERFQVLHKVALDRIRSHERLSGDIIENGASELLHHGKIQTLEEKITDMGTVTHEDVIALTKKVFDPEYVFTEVIFPSKK